MTEYMKALLKALTAVEEARSLAADVSINDALALDDAAQWIKDVISDNPPELAEFDPMADKADQDYDDMKIREFLKPIDNSIDESISFWEGLIESLANETPY